MDTLASRTERPYHHGDLKTALLAEAERILERDGIQALTLRAAARAVGVSHAAPANHFGDLTGLLSELAAVGFRRFAATLAAEMDAGPTDADTRMAAMGRAYVDFARAHPGLFVLMFRSERLDLGRPALRAAVDEAREALHEAVAARMPGSPPGPFELTAQAAALWSLVHGFAMLLIDGRLDEMIRALPGKQDADSLLAAMLATVHVGD